MEWCPLVARLLATPLLHLCHTRKCHAKNHHVYIVINITLKHTTGMSRNRTDILKCFSARDVSFKKFLDRQRQSKQAD